MVILRVQTRPCPRKDKQEITIVLKLYVLSTHGKFASVNLMDYGKFPCMNLGHGWRLGHMWEMTLYEPGSIFASPAAGTDAGSIDGAASERAS